jgi:hypothetical protein
MITISQLINTPARPILAIGPIAIASTAVAIADKKTPQMPK